MKPIEIKDVNIFTAMSGDVQVVCLVPRKYADEACTAALTASERLKAGKPVALTVEAMKKPRSLTANAYFHLLANKIAAALKIGDDEAKKQLVLDYGVPVATAKFPKGADVANYWNYAKFIGETTTYREYMLYKPTHTLDSAEMTRLIEGTVYEAKQLGIDTLTPREIAQLGGIDGTDEKECRKAE